MHSSEKRCVLLLNSNSNGNSQILSSNSGAAIPKTRAFVLCFFEDQDIGKFRDSFYFLDVGLICRWSWCQRETFCSLIRVLFMNHSDFIRHWYYVVSSLPFVLIMYDGWCKVYYIIYFYPYLFFFFFLLVYYIRDK